MPDRRWLLRIFPIGKDGKPTEGSMMFRSCTSGENAKSWGKRLTPEALHLSPQGIRCVIFDPAGRSWAEADVTIQSQGRMRWV
jgi:hypothetical protein